MAGGSKPRPGTRAGEKFKDGAKKSGGIKTPVHGGPSRASRPPPKGVKESQLQRRARP
jgi:hypothetical protein